ncbi:hypothetical protein EG327_000997 [Venturia inaequalis]|uniref:Helicase C-terminal domain-containing protein n=1 Tax=Venturia inaequalis TaxID=5025 RepID=A0A8H3VKC4_VENIN|nr:hypothetical protein EG327_000997 [Venturia inaequalis]
MAIGILRYFKGAVPSTTQSDAGKRKRDALAEHQSPRPGARLLDCVLIPTSSPTLSSTPNAPIMTRKKASVRKPTKSAKKILEETVKEPARRQTRKPPPKKTPAKEAKTSTSKVQAAPIEISKDDPVPSTRRSGRAPRQSYIFTASIDDDSDEEMEEVEEAVDSDFEGLEEVDIELEDDDDQMSDIDQSMADDDSIRWKDSDNHPDLLSECDIEEASDLDIGIAEEPTTKKRKLNSSKPQAQLAGTKPKTSKRDLDLNLPPLAHIEDIFLDITKKALSKGLDQAIGHLKGGALKVGTMCSGTEAPLLALRLVQQCLRDDLNVDSLEVDHIFSAEIEAFKQAYIERNFHPNLLLRDITELYIDQNKQMKGTTAYGAEVDVPRDIHVLVAGSSCVDFSTLNTAQVNGFGERKGESEDTFMAVLKYTQWARPPIVILENVDKDEAWKEFTRHFDKIGYSTEIVKVDTKDYYLPQTRVRRYMLCLDKKVYKSAKSQELAKWRGLMTEFKRRASSSLPIFLLSEDDPRHVALLTKSQGSSRDTGGMNTSWEACRGRHLAVRLEDRLGHKKPVMMVLPEHCDVRWIQRRVDRETDVIEICYLKRAKDLIDSRFKTRVIDLSQNIERVDNAPLGISGCLTPSGIPYLTDRAGPLTGLHALQLQGIPIEELIFTSETDAELRDLAGNAMSSTIVGCAILGALIVAADKLTVPKTLTSKSDSAEMIRDQIATSCDLEKLDQTSVASIQIPADLLLDASNSSRKCHCEARTLVSNYEIQVCIDCNHTACRKCAGNPKHNYKDVIKRSTRLTPHEFESKWRANFPLRLKLRAPLKKIESEKSSMDADIADQYFLAITEAVEDELVLLKFHRDQHWHICYESAHAMLELKLDSKPEWRLIVKPAPELPANSKLRRIFGKPIACSTSDVTIGNISLSLAWWIPSTREIEASISGQGSQSSWRAAMDLTDYIDEKVCDSLDIVVQGSPTLDCDVSGTYKLLPDCGTAYNSLHKRVSDKPSDSSKDMFFFMDPDPVGSAADDQFVFSKDHERQQNPTHTREVEATMDSWRPWDQNRTKSAIIQEKGFWSKSEEARLDVVEGDLEYHRMTRKETEHHDGLCSKAETVLAVRFKAPSDILPSWRAVRSVAVYNRYFYSHLAWPLRDGSLMNILVDWMSIDSSSFQGFCESCSPARPAIRWRQGLARKSKQDSSTTIKLVVQEDRLAAAAYERALKNRPSPYFILANVDDSGIAHVDVGVNRISLAHRALEKLRVASSATPSVRWRLDSNFVNRAVTKFPRFTLKSNRGDAMNSQIDGMKLDLRPEQLRSLTWMRAQEHKSGVYFKCQEVEEAVHPKLGWKTEVQATAEIRVKGGVLADQPSYGKTVTSLALIHAGFVEAEDQEANMPESLDEDFLKLNATLIVTPHHLIKQWRDEISKFLPNDYGKSGVVLVISSPGDWKKYSMLHFMNARIVILSWKVLIHESYVGQLALFTALPHPNLGGREYKTWLEYATASIPSAIAALKKAKDIPAFAKERAELFSQNCEDSRFKADVPSHRVKGAKYAAKASKCKSPPTVDNAEFERPDGILKKGVNGTSVEWEGLAHPPFHLFRWNRLLVDEYALLADKMSGSERTAAYGSVLQLKADKRWILSGTPALNDFVDVKAIAGLLGVYLGIDAFVPELLGAKKLKSLREDLSKSELFQAFQEVHSSDWHMNRHTHAQKFLDVFVRQNDAEIGHIETRSQLNPVRLAPAHRAVYEELSHYLQAADMSMRESANQGSDREEKINQSIKEANDAEEAMLRSAASFDASGSLDSFNDLVNLRQGQLDSLKADLRALLRLAQHLRQKKNQDANERFSKWNSEPVDDSEAKILLDEYVDEVKKLKVSDERAAAVMRRLMSSAKDAGKPDSFFKIEGAAVLPKMKEAILKLRPHVRELTSRIRSLRFVQAIRSLQNSTESADCEKCQSSVELSSLRLVSTCGHKICKLCLETSMSTEHCLLDGCNAEIDQRCIKPVENYLDTDVRPTGRSFGAKFDSIAKILEQLPEEDQAILFIPGDGLMKDAAECFEHHGISHVTAYEDDKDLINKIEGFKEDKSVEERDRVLVMNINGDHATGLNLTNANHIIFLSPLHAPDQYGYESKMLQAIRRAHRFGQEKIVHIYRFVALKTIDVNILENRERGLDQPVWEEPEDSPSLRQVHGFEPRVEMARVVGVGGKMALAPRSWVEKHRLDVDVGGGFAADVQLSNAYEELEEVDAVDE